MNRNVARLYMYRNILATFNIYELSLKTIMMRMYQCHRSIVQKVARVYPTKCIALFSFLNFYPQEKLSHNPN